MLKVTELAFSAAPFSQMKIAHFFFDVDKIAQLAFDATSLRCKEVTLLRLLLNQGHAHALHAHALHATRLGGHAWYTVRSRCTTKTLDTKTLDGVGELARISLHAPTRSEEKIAFFRARSTSHICSDVSHWRKSTHATHSRMDKLTLCALFAALRHLEKLANGGRRATGTCRSSAFARNVEEVTLCTFCAASLGGEEIAQARCYGSVWGCWVSKIARISFDTSFGGDVKIAHARFPNLESVFGCTARPCVCVWFV